ncbi:MAG: hypothetical protein JSS77_14145 [Acidobacteria bacterium]|nr:hypothetical protein [Acidobacteriota bacterium]
MRSRHIILSLMLLTGVSGCSAGSVPPKPSGDSRLQEQATSTNAQTTDAKATAANGAESQTAGDLMVRPKTVRDFFMLLPVKYFPLESCDSSKDKGCQRAKADYLKTFVEVEDTGNGYLRAGCDGAQSCLEMAIFKKPNGEYLVGVRADFEMGSDSYFVDYDNGKWTDVGRSTVDGFSEDLFYVFPRVGTTVEVFEKLPIDSDTAADSPKGKKLYDLEWKEGRFTRKK